MVLNALGVPRPLQAPDSRLNSTKYAYFTRERTLLGPLSMRPPLGPSFHSSLHLVMHAWAYDVIHAHTHACMRTLTCGNSCAEENVFNEETELVAPKAQVLQQVGGRK